MDVVLSFISRFPSPMEGSKKIISCSVSSYHNIGKERILHHFVKNNNLFAMNIVNFLSFFITAN